MQCAVSIEDGCSAAGASSASEFRRQASESFTRPSIGFALVEVEESDVKAEIQRVWIVSPVERVKETKNKMQRLNFISVC